MTAKKPREIAVQVLREHAQRKDFVENLLERALAETPVAAADRRLIHELTFGVVRWQATLDWLIARKTTGRAQKADLQLLLRLGLYQMFWLDRIPDHALVHETVELAKSLGFAAQAGFVNAVLRGYLRERDQTRASLEALKVSQPALGYSHPEWLCERWGRRWGADPLRRLLEWNNRPPPTYARLNTLKCNAAGLTERWAQEGVGFEARQWDWTGPGLVFELQVHPALTGLASFNEGLFYIQDPSTLLAVRALDPRPGDRVLDLCAAPGGKTTYMAQLMENRGFIQAEDPVIERRRLIFENCRRLGVTCARLALSDDGLRQEADSKYDRVLLDVPCSNTGVIRRRVEVRWRLQPAELTRLRATQLELLHKAAAQTAEGGTMVYSTCSLEPEENGDVIREFLKEHHEFELASERELLPFSDGVDGAYVAKLVRR